MQNPKLIFCKVWFNTCAECGRKFAAQRITQSLCRFHAQRAIANPVAYTAANKRVARFSAEEANKLVHWRLADWRGRKHGKALTLLVPAGHVLSIVGLWRLGDKVNPLAMDSKTHTFTGPRTWKHTRNDHYWGGVSRVIDIVEQTDEQAA